MLFSFLLLLFMNSTFAQPILETCKNCHSSSNQKVEFHWKNEDQFKKHSSLKNQCIGCHTQMVAAYEHFNRKPLWLWSSDEAFITLGKNRIYLHTPPLDWSIEGIPIYTHCGIDLFLKSPIPRSFKNQESMFSILHKQRKKLIQEIDKRLEKCRPIESELIERGRQLYKDKNCILCHSSQGQGPRLRLGYPLISKSYFDYSLKNGGGKRWSSSVSRSISKQKDPQHSTMPSFTQLSDEDKRALYAYVSTDSSDRPKDQLPGANSPTFGIELYRKVQKNIFSKSCQHCHSSSKKSSEDNERVFGTRTTNFTFPRPGEKAFKSLHLNKILSPRKNCQSSELIERLEIRWLEWTGKKPDHEVRRGMPMTMPPISKADIMDLKLWTQMGCPTGTGNLCSECQSNR